jgi:hypothetical protein
VLYLAAEGKVVTQLGPERTLPHGQVRISVLPRGWVDASALEPLAGGEFLKDKGSQLVPATVGESKEEKKITVADGLPQ